jgi:hypothetical protein
MESAYSHILKFSRQLLSDLISPLDRLGPADLFPEDILSHIVHYLVDISITGYVQSRGNTVHLSHKTYLNHQDHT